MSERQTARELYFNVLYIFDYKKYWDIPYLRKNDKGEIIYFEKGSCRVDFTIDHEINIKKMEETEKQPDFAYWSPNSPETKTIIKIVKENGKRIR